MISFSQFDNQKGIVHGVSEIEDGSFNFYTSPEAVPNLLVLLEESGVKKEPGDIILAEQVHGKKVHLASSRLSGYIKLGMDGLVSDRPGPVLMVKTADCLPVLIFNPVKRKVGAFHAGRRGIRKGILRQGVEKMENPKSLLVGIGPHIKRCCYFFEPQVWKKWFAGGFWEKYTEKEGGGFRLDLTGAALDRLCSSGVKRRNIEVSEFCTFCHSERFFSRLKMEKEKSVYKEHGRLPAIGTFIGLI